MKVTISKKHIECARIYIDKSNRAKFRIKCYYCCSIFVCWSRFVQHIGTRHSDLETSYQHAQIIWNNINSTIAGEEQRKNAKESIKKERKQMKTEDKGKEFLTEIAVELLCDKPNNEPLSKNTFHDLSVSYFENIKRNTQDYTDADASNNSESQILLIDSNKRKKKTNYKTKSTNNGRVFYHMRYTKPEILLNFIDIIQEHSCQWNPHDPDYHIKEKRDESSEQIRQMLEERWGITITVQTVRSSVLALCRWFELEYARHLDCSGVYKSVYTVYYKRLYAFLPHDLVNSFTCDQCERKFKSEPLLLSHKYAVHNGDIPFRCGFCNRGFIHLSSFRHHENRHTKARVWPCELCDYEGLSKTDYILHKNTHSDIRAFVCDLCSAAYKSSTSLSVHKRSHGPPRLKCPECGRQFHENYRLKRHMWIHSTKDSEPEKDKKKKGKNVSTTLLPIAFQCDICHRKFSRKKNLEKHILEHKFKCNKISLGFDNEAMIEKKNDSIDIVEQLNISDSEDYVEYKFSGFNIKNCELEHLLEEDCIFEVPENISKSHDVTIGHLEVYSCQICQQQFITLQNLQNHTKKVHKMKDI